MKRSWICSVLILASIASLSFAESFNVKNVIYGTTNLKAVDKSSGAPLWESVLKVEKGKGFIYSEERGAGIWGQGRTYKTWDTKAYFKLEGTKLVPDQVEIVFKDKNGSVIQTIKKSYDRRNHAVYCAINGKTKTFDFDVDLIDKEEMGVCASNYDFDLKKDLVFHFLSNQPTRYKMTLKYLGTETIRNILCYKLQLIPDLGALNMIGAFVPKTYFWMEAASPHDFVRYEGLESGLGTPYIVLEKAK